MTHFPFPLDHFRPFGWILCSNAFTLGSRSLEIEASEDPIGPQPMEEPLHCRTRELVDFLEQAPVDLQWVGPDGSILWANATELELLGYTRAVREFAAVSRQRTFAPGIGLPGRIWASGAPTWVADITRDDNFPRSPVAAQEGLHGAFGFPILYGHEILGIVEFFSRTIRQPDDALLQMMATIGSQIDQFMARKRVEEALEQSRRLQALFDHALDAILLANGEGHYVDANPAACALTGYSREELLQLTVWDLTPVPNHERARQLWDMFIAGGHQSGEYTLRCKDRTLAEIEYHAVANIVPGLHLSVLHDITARKRVEERQRFLTEASVGLAASLDYETALAGLTRCLVPSLADWCVIDMFEEDGWVYRRALIHKDAEKETLL
jgi:PAS domain S-box-containing protein